MKKACLINENAEGAYHANENEGLRSDLWSFSDPSLRETDLRPYRITTLPKPPSAAPDIASRSEPPRYKTSLR